MRKPAFCICENKDADQLRGQRLCFSYPDNTIPLLPQSEISSFYPYSVIAQLGLCPIWLEIQKTGFSRVAAQLLLEKNLLMPFASRK